MQEKLPTAYVVMTQYNMMEILQKFDNQGTATVEKKLVRLLKIDAINPDNPKEPTN